MAGTCLSTQNTLSHLTSTSPGNGRELWETLLLPQQPGTASLGTFRPQEAFGTAQEPAQPPTRRLAPAGIFPHLHTSFPFPEEPKQAGPNAAFKAFVSQGKRYGDVANRAFLQQTQPFGRHRVTLGTTCCTRPLHQSCS